MLQPDWLQLLNGTDIRGIAMDGIIGERVTLSTSKVAALGRAFAQWLQNKGSEKHLRIAVGHDCRLTSAGFMEVLEESITATGCDVLNCGIASTPSMLLSTSMVEVKADGAIMITASHLPFNRNGLKFFYNGSYITKEELAEITELAQDSSSAVGGEQGAVHICNILSVYSARLRNKILGELTDAPNPQRPLEGIKIVVDAGNGVGAFFAKRVLEPLGADIDGCQFLEPDGRFPHHEPNPEHYEAMRALQGAVCYSKADMGVLFDADVDRVAIVDAEGRTINRNKLVAMASALVLAEHPQSTIVTDSITSTGICTFIADVMGGKHRRFQRGYANVISEAKRLNSIGDPCWLAVETSGHAAFRENSFYDDGAYLATKLVIKLAQLKREGKGLYSLIEKLPEPVETKEFRLNILANDFSRVASDVLSGLRLFVSQMAGWEEVAHNPEGVRVMCTNDNEKGWFIFRQSLHDPVMPLNIESDIEGGATAITTKLKLFFRNAHNVDSSVLYR